jgi:hypothetical protein
LKILRRKLGDITNDGDEGRKSKRPRVHSSSESPGSDNEDVGSRADDTFIYQAGHKFFLINGPWIHQGEDLFGIQFDEAYNAAERFENNESKAQGQLQEVWRLLYGKFEREALQEKWVHRAVRYVMLFRLLFAEILAVYERTQD